MDANPHVHVFVAVGIELFDGLDHAEPHLHAVGGVVRSRLWAAGHAIITVAQRGDLFALALDAHPVKPTEQIVEEADQLAGGFVTRHPREAHDVSKQDGDVFHRVHIERSEDGPNISLIGGTRT